MENKKEKYEGRHNEKAVNQTKQNITDEEVEKILSDAKGKLQKDRSVENTLHKMPKDAEDKSRNDTADVEMEPIIDNTFYEKENTISIGRIIGAVFEGIWTGIKLIVIVGIITGVVGFLLSRNLLVRGRNGDRECLSGIVVSPNVSARKSVEESKVEEWLKTVSRKKITLEADDNRILVARKMVVNSGSEKWVVILHGYNENMADVYDMAMHYAEEGYNILTPDLRANGESEGAFLGMGWLDRLDVINWIDVILEENPSAQIVIHGVDMGADTALMLSGEPLKGSIKAIVAEGAYTNAWDVTKKEYKERYEKLPVFPFMHMMLPVMKVWAGYDLKEADAVKQVEKTTIPILLICGKNDTYASEDMTKKLDETIASQHEVMTIEAGSHGDCRYADPENYYSKTFEFVGKYIN